MNPGATGGRDSGYRARAVSQETPIRADDVRRAAEQVRGCDAREPLSLLAWGVLARQAEGRTLFAGKEHVATLAEAHGVRREDADVSGQNLLTILERGPKGPGEHALVAAFYVDGMGRTLASATHDDRAALCERFIHHADWLEVATPYVVYAFVDALVGEAERQAIWAALGRAVLEEAEASGPPRHDARARNAARVSALAASESASAREALGRIAREADDLVVRRLATELGGDAGGDADATRLSGRPGVAARSTAATVARLVTGLAALTWALRLVGNLVGIRREADMELVPGGLVVRSRLSLLGRIVREREERFTMAALAGVAREVRYPMVHLVVGLISLSAGILLGGLLAFDAIVTGETILLLLAAVLVFVGGALDLALDMFLPARAGRVSVDLSLLPGRRFRLERVPVETVDAFLATLKQKSR